MPRYTINATLAVPAWADVEADSEEEAEAHAQALDADGFEYDLSAATVEFNVIPVVAVA